MLVMGLAISLGLITLYFEMLGVPQAEPGVLATLAWIALERPGWVRRLYRWAGFLPPWPVSCDAVILKARIVDGDTVDDLRTGVRYRLHNIDAPETGRRAGCWAERQRGEQAAARARELARKAERVEARPVGKIDRYGRTVAMVLIDGEDLGATLMAEGLAHAWSGQRERWCGPNGALVRVTRQAQLRWSCRACSARCGP